MKDAATGETFATRAGDFREDNAGYLVTNNGLRVQGVADMINAPTVIGDIQVDRGTYTTNRTVGSINTATDGLTIAAHGYLTGNQVNFTTSGTLPTSTPAIYSATTYFVRTIDANTISLHTTASGAAADTDRIDFTGTGTGTHTLTPGASVSSWSVGADGKVNMLLTDGAQYVRGQILMQTFNNPQALLRAGQNLYSNLSSAGPFTGAGYSSSTAVLASAKPPGSGGLGRVQSGSLELSNVDMAKEFATMITTQRAFQANARIITTSDEMLQEMMTLKR